MSDDTNQNHIVRIADVITFVEGWAPRGAAMSHDNPGLQVGDPGTPLKNILVALEVTDRVIEEAIENEANLILAHHPLIFKPVHRVDASDGLGRQLARLIKNDIAVYSAHTNLDVAPEGVSITLARLLGVEKPRFLAPPDRPWMKKLAVFVPETHLDTMREAMAKAGAGTIGNYTDCSFNLTGTGTFLGREASTPAVGIKGRLERVQEIKLEMILPAWNLEAVVRAMKAAHPYEEVAFDVYPLENADVNFGFGAIGDLPQPLPVPELLKLIKDKLGVASLGFMEGPAEQVTRLAVCGGSAGELVEAAWKQGAQAYLTGEIKYHTLLEYEDRLTVVVAGHYATEAVILPVWIKRLEAWLKDEPVSVIETKMITNPMKYLT